MDNVKNLIEEFEKIQGMLLNISNHPTPKEALSIYEKRMLKIIPLLETLYPPFKKERKNRQKRIMDNAPKTEKIREKIMTEITPMLEKAQTTVEQIKNTER